MTLREAVRSALEGRQKEAAFASFPDRKDAEAELSKILAGERRPTWALLEYAFAEAPCGALLEWVERTAHVECRPLPQPAAHELELIREALQGLGQHTHELQERVERALARLEEEPPRPAPLRVAPERRTRRAG